MHPERWMKSRDPGDMLFRLVKEAIVTTYCRRLSFQTLRPADQIVKNTPQTKADLWFHTPFILRLRARKMLTRSENVL